MTELPEYVLTREFNAPRQLVWQAWTDPSLLSRWYGPGVETVIHEFDLRPGGVWRNEMRMQSMSDYSKMVFSEVRPPDQIIWNHHSTDANWNVASNPMMPDWPKTLRTTITFTGDNPTLVTLHQVPVNASAAEIACFADMMRNMDGGWGKGYAVMDTLLAELA